MSTQQPPSIVEALAENLRSIGKTARPIWGWFVVSVFIVGVPRVLEISANGIKQGYSTVRCALTSCSVEGSQYTDAEIVDMALKIAERENPGKYAEIVLKKK